MRSTMPRSPKSDNSGDETGGLVDADSLDSDNELYHESKSKASDQTASMARSSAQGLASLQLFRSESLPRKGLGSGDPKAYKSQSLEVVTEMLSLETEDMSLKLGFDPRRWIVAVGLLEKRRDGRMRDGWARRFFVLGKNALYYYLLPKTDMYGYTPLLGDERGWIKLTDIQDVKANGRDSNHCYITVTVAMVRKNNASQYFNNQVSQLQLRTPAETGELWLQAIIKARDEAKSSSSPSRTGSMKKTAETPTSALLLSHTSSTDDHPRSPSAAAALPFPPPAPAPASSRPAEMRPRRDSSKIRSLDLIPLDQSFPFAAPLPMTPLVFLLSALVALVYQHKLGVSEHLPQYTRDIPGHVYAGLAIIVLGFYFLLYRRSSAHDSVAREARFRVGVMRDEVNAFKKAESLLGADDSQGDEKPVLLPVTSSEIARLEEECENVRHVAGTSTKFASEAMRPGIDFMCWSDAHGVDFKLRIGPNYKKNNQKAPSGDPLYTLVALDLLRSKDRLSKVGASEHIVLPAYRSESEASWEDIKRSGLPRLFIVNAQIPDKAPSLIGRQPDDPGCSLVFYFVAKPQTIKEALSSNPSPAIKLVKQYVKEHASNPDIRRRFKAIGMADKAKELNISIPGVKTLIEKFNGKPAIINKVAQVYESEQPLEWFEIDISIFDFPYTAKTTLSAIKDRVSEMLLRAGFVFQGESDEELPEILLGGADMCGLDFRLAKVI